MLKSCMKLMIMGVHILRRMLASVARQWGSYKWKRSSYHVK